MTAPWIKREGWLKDYVKPKPKIPVQLNPQTEDSKPQEKSLFAVPYYPIKCPKCNSKDVKLYKTNYPIRYHICRKCGWHFKSIEKDSA